MGIYRAPVAVYQEILSKMAKEDDVFDQQTLEQVLNAIAQYCETMLLDSNVDEVATYDEKKCSVMVAKAYHEAYRVLCENGYASLALPAEYGGSGASWVLHHVVSEMLASANLSLTTCPMLTNGALEALIKNASDDILERYSSALIQGKFTATMCLTEPQCGTDLGLITTKAEPQDDHYLISGQKIWITFGEHDLAENIVHLVLAKTPNAPEGSKGISMFVVPKILPDGTRNTVHCIGLEHKMGQHGSPTAVMAFEKARGWIVGDEFKGMKMMFEMMNPARIGVGVQALGLSEIAYQTALGFATKRRQSRSLNKRKQDASERADLVIVHPDIRRMLLGVHVTTVAMRWMVAYCSQKLDTKDDALSGLLTPIIKSYVTEQSVQNISDCMQIMGGLGYVQDGLCEKYYRDARITMIYEGTNGIQALDLIGRKVAKDMGKGLRQLLKELESMPILHGDSNVKSVLLKDVTQANYYLMKQALNPEKAAAIAPYYLKILALSIQYSLMAQYENDQELVLYYGLYCQPLSALYLAQIQQGGEAYMNYTPYN